MSLGEKTKELWKNKEYREMNKQVEGFELFLTKKYNAGEISAKEYSQINLLLGEYEQSAGDLK